MKRLFVVPLMIVIASVLIFTGWALPTQAATPEKPVKLRFAVHMPDTNRLHRDGLVPWAKKVEEATKGRVKIIFYTAQSLCKAKDSYDSVVSGIADLSWQVTAYTPGRFPLSELFMLPMIGLPDGERSSRILWELYNKFPQAYNREYGDVKVLGLNAAEPVVLGSSKKPVRTAKDMNGLKMRGLGGPPATLFNRLGSVLIKTSIVEIYSSMEAGIVEAYVNNWHGTGDYRLYEVANYFTDLNFYNIVFYMIMNPKKWNSLPPDIQEQIMSVSGLKGSMALGKCFDITGVESKEQVAKMEGKKIISPTAEEVATFVEVARPIWSDYVAKLEAKGFPGQAIFDEMMRLIEKYGK